MRYTYQPDFDAATIEALPLFSRHQKSRDLSPAKVLKKPSRLPPTATLVKAYRRNIERRHGQPSATGHIGVVQQTEADPIASKFLGHIERGDTAVGLIDRPNNLTINVGNLHAIQKQAEMFANAILVDKASYDLP